MIDQTLYEVLGLKPDASADDIKKAYKRLAQLHHPDKPLGDAETFRRIAYAYGRLIDPGSRLLYDETGREDPEPDPSAEIQDALTKGFQKALQENADDILKAVSAFLDEGVAIINKQKKTFKAELAESRKRRNWLTTTKEKNYYRLIVDANIKACQQNIAECKRQLKIIDLCRQELASYSSSQPQPEPPLSESVIVYYDGTNLRIKQRETPYTSLGKIFERDK